MARNYFKVVQTEAVASSRVKVPDIDTPAWSTSIRARIQRITRLPPRPIDWERFFFFDDDSPEDTARAWFAAVQKVGGNQCRVHIARYSPIQGPWSRAPEIGELHSSTLLLS